MIDTQRVINNILPGKKLRIDKRSKNMGLTWHTEKESGAGPYHKPKRGEKLFMNVIDYGRPDGAKRLVVSGDDVNDNDIVKFGSVDNQEDVEEARKYVQKKYGQKPRVHYNR